VTANRLGGYSRGGGGGGFFFFLFFYFFFFFFFVVGFREFGLGGTVVRIRGVEVKRGL